MHNVNWLQYHVRRDLGTLGTVDADVADVEKRVLFSPARFEAKAKAQLARLSDSVQQLFTVAARL